MPFVERISSREAFVNLEAAWNALLKNSNSDTIFLTHQWLLTWWDIFGEGRELHILVVREADEIIGIAPLLKRRVLNFGLPYQRLEFLASGEDEADEICSEYLDFILLQGHEADAIAALFKFLQEACDWDEILLKELPEASCTSAHLEKGAETASMKCEITPMGEAVFLPLPDNMEAFIAGFSKKLRHQVRKDRQRALEEHFRLDVIDDLASLPEGFEKLVHMHQALWTSRGEPGVFASEKFSRFHREVVKKLIELQQVRIFILNFENAAVAGLYLFVYANKVFFYQSGFVPGGPVQSPGTLVRNLAIEHSLQNGLTEWDFLKTQPGSYKHRWSSHSRQIRQVRIARTHFKEAVYTSSNRVVDGLKQVKRALKR